jgi:LacI family transcriptional regulator
LDANFVGVDDETVGELATEHLVSIGCRRIAHIRGPQISTATGRLEGYRRVLGRHNLDPDPSWIPAATAGDEDSEARGRKAMRQLLKAHPRPDGVFCYNDPAAMGAMNEILDAGLRIPEDIALIGCGNVHYGASLRVPLSSIDQQSGTIGERAAKLALSLVESKRAAPKTILLKPKLVARASTARS